MSLNDPPTRERHPDEARFDVVRSRLREAVRAVLNGSAVLSRRLRTPDEPGATRFGRSRATLDADRDDWPQIAIIVLTWENYEEASDCLDSLESIDYPNYRVIVVDNGSQDGSVDTLQHEFGWCEFIRNGENLGFARGNNVGIRHALQTEADYILLLNDDTVVTAGFLAPLVETMRRYERVAAVGGINRHATTGEIHNAGYEFFPSLGGQAVRYLRPREQRPYSVGYIQSCLVLLNPAFLEEIGLLSDHYFIGLEDVDLAWQAHRGNWQVLMNPASEIYHRVGTTAERGPFNVYHRTRNRLHFANEHLSILRQVLFVMSFVLWTGISCLTWWMDGESRNIRATILGVMDYVTGRRFRPYDEFA